MKKKKTILIDFLVHRSNLNCGFGQITYNYGYLFGNMELDDIEFTFLVPKQFVGCYGNKVKYIAAKKIYKYLPFLLPKFDLWHSIHQSCKIRRIDGNTKYVFTIHDLNILYELPPKKMKKYRRRIQKGINKADIITVISSFTETEIRRNMNLHNKPVAVIYNGVQQIDSAKEQQPTFIKNADRPFFFTVGQVRRKKNFHVLLDVMKAFPEYDLYIAGENNGKYAEEINKRIYAEKLSNVFMPGVISHKEKVWFYRHCKAFLFPSLLEGFGIPVIEAMQFGKPVFASSRTSLPEITNGHAFLWENFEPDYMIQSIKQFMSGFYENPDNAEKEKVYARTFSYEKHVETYVDLYRRLLS